MWYNLTVDRFGNEETRLVAEGRATKATRRILPSNLHEKAARAIDFVLRVRSPQDCAIFRDFKMLKGRLRGEYQFRISGEHRIRFGWDGRRAVNIRVGEFHDEDKR